MEAQIRLPNGIVLKVTGETQKELFRELASAQEVFGEHACGLCKSEDISFAYRTATRVQGKKTETFEYPEYRCNKCGAKLSMGTMNDTSGRLFPVRKLIAEGPEKGKPSSQHGTWDRDGRGWTKYRGQPKAEEAETPF